MTSITEDGPEPDDAALYALAEEDVAPDLERAFETVFRASRETPFPVVAVREDRIARLVAMTEAAEKLICEAINTDFGGRSAVETRLAETGFVIASGQHARRKVKGWMKTRPAPTGLAFRPLSNSVLPQPLGVVGVLSPWNYPYHLAIAPLIGAFAAGNRALLKPSEKTPATSGLIAELVAQRFDAAELAVVQGGPATGSAFAALPFDHLFFTGSVATGERVAVAAAHNLCSVTLELGGKCPVVIDPSADLDQAATQVAWGKWFNAGQTCVAPDYVLVPDDLKTAFVEKLTEKVRALYPAKRIERDYTAIISDENYRRLVEVLEEADGFGASIVRPCGPDRGRRMTPTIVVEPADNARIMTEEIFGPLIAVLGCPDTESAIRRISEGERPLAAYWFGWDRGAEATMARDCVTGGLSVNTCMVQVAQQELPFGGVGASGQGHYHGRWGFDQFSKLKPVTRRGRHFIDPSRFLQPPYGPSTRSAIEIFRKLIRFGG